MIDPAISQLPIDFAESVVEQLSLTLDASDPGTPYSARLKDLFEDSAPWRERREAILNLLDGAQSEIAPRTSPRLLYFRARMEANDTPDSSPETVAARWTRVNEAWRSELGTLSGDACARIGFALLDLHDPAAALPYLDAALESFERAVREGRRPQPAPADRQWMYDVKRARCRALLLSRDPCAYATGIVELLRLQTEHDRLARGRKAPVDEAFASLGSVMRGRDGDPRVGALVDALTEHCGCGARTLASEGIPLEYEETILGEAARTSMERDHAMAFEVARALWLADPGRFADLLAATVARTPIAVPQGAQFSASVQIGDVDAAFDKQDYAKALRLLENIERIAPDEIFRVAYWRGQCLRHQGRWGDAIAAFERAESGPDPLLRAWAQFRLVQCALRITQVSEFFDRDWAAIRPYRERLVECHKAAPNSRRIAFVAACALVADGEGAAALPALRAVDVSFRFYRAAQWVGCLATLQTDPIDWAGAARELRRHDAESAWRLPVIHAREILEICTKHPDEATAIAHAVFDESRDIETDGGWARLLTEVVYLAPAFTDKHLLGALDDAFDRALAAEESMAVLRSIAEARLDVADMLGGNRLVSTALDVARTFAAFGERDLTVRSTDVVLKDPSVANIAAAVEAAGVLLGLGDDASASAAVERWRSALAASGDAGLASLDRFLGAETGADSRPTLPGQGKRIALFGGHANQRRSCTRALLRLGFDEASIEWKDADEGQRLSFADCEPLLKGAFDYYVLVTSAIGHATSMPIMTYLRSSSKRWWALAISGHESFGKRMTVLLEARS